MLRLLKSRAVQSVKGAAPLLGYSERQLLRWWACYKTGGLDALIEQHSRTGRLCRLTQDVNACVMLRPNNFDPPCDFLSKGDTLQDSHSVFQPHSSSVRLPHPAAGRLHLDMLW
jgi:Helix-turn-helix domain